jgi:competence protein ComEC
LGLVKALLTGERDSISDSLYQSMQRAGAAHIVSVSGLHVLMLTQLLLAIPMEHRRKRIVLIPFLVFFAMMTGGRPAIVRAVLMVILLQLGPLFDRDYDAPTSLAAALLLLLLHNPFSIGGVGLQLSFAAVGGILLISNPLNQWFEMRLKVIQGKKQLAPPLRGICGIVSMSCGALLFSTPLCAYYFGYISLVGLLSSILILPVLGVLFATSLLSILLSYFAMPLALPLATVSDVIAGYVNFVCRQLGSWNFSALSMEVDAFVIWLVLVYACIIALFLWKWLRRKFYLPVAFAGISLLCSICFHIWNTTSAPISITVLDVGQGQCIAALSDDESIAVDCGGNSGDAGDHLADFLQNLNRRHLDALVLTHFDSDHTNGLSELFSRIQIDTIYAPDLGNSGQAQVVKLAEKNGCDVVLLSDDDAFSFGEGTVRLLHLPATEEEVENNDGISVLLSYEADDFLITGDLDLENEALLVESEDLSDIEYLVAGHHGSKYASSDALLAAITPDTAIISVGYNTYGHPTEDALNRLNSYVKELYRTDENGSVLIKLGVEK